MITKQEPFLTFLGKENLQFVIPFYQRTYAWTTHQCQELWNDICRSNTPSAAHFMNMVLFLDSEDAPGDSLPDCVRRVDIIDGQQRIATLLILLCALAHRLRESGQTVAGMDADALSNRYLRAFANEAAPCKMTLLGLDGATLSALVADTDLPEKPSLRVLSNYRFFREQMAEPNFAPHAFWSGLEQLLIISVELDEPEKAQAIFESLNAKGLPLSTADLVRNYLLVAETQSEQERLYQEYWRPIELMFGEDKGSVKLNAGIRMWLTIRFKRGRIRKKGQTYDAFKAYMTQEFEGTTEELLDELRSFCLMWAENYKDHDIMTSSKEFRSWDWAKGKSKTLLPGWGTFSGF